MIKHTKINQEDKSIMESHSLEFFKEQFKSKQKQEMTLMEYLEMCKEDSSCYATAAERMVKAIGKPEIFDSNKDERLSRIFSNKKIKIYPAFFDFYGMEDTIESIV